MPVGKVGLARVSKLNLWLRHFTNETCSTTFLNKKESARRAGYKTKNEDSLATIGWQNFRKLEDQLTIWFDEALLSENALKNKLLSLLNAKETKFFHATVTDENDKVSDIMIKEVEVEAIETQRKTLDMALKLRNMYPAVKHEVAGKNGGPIEQRVFFNEELESQILARLKNDGKSISAREEIEITGSGQT